MSKALQSKEITAYEQLLSKITGENICITSGKANDVIGALCSDSGNFDTFKENFTARLERLNAITLWHEAFITKAKNVANNSWEGPYAELAAYDWMASDPNLPIHDIQLDVPLDPKDTYALEMGRKGVDEDGYIEELSVYFDVKSLSDNTGNFITKVMDAALSELYPAGTHRPIVVPSSYTMDSARLIDETSAGNGSLFRNLKTELRDALNAGKTRYVSAYSSGLEFSIAYKGGESGCKSMSPYCMASADLGKVLSYSYKFTKDKPFILVLVAFPWYNHEISFSDDFNREYYRSLARRAFCQYKDLSTPASSVIPGFAGSESAYDVTRRLSAIILLEDKSIGNDSSLPVSMIRSYVYTNPNAANPINDRCTRWLERQAGLCAFDGFEYDNY